MVDSSYRGTLYYDEIVPLEVASFGDGALTKVQFDERIAGHYWTGRADGALVAFMNASVNEAGVHIMHIEVSPGHRRRGIAHRLLSLARAFAKEQGKPRLTLRVRDDNAPARALYLKFGFRETGRRQCRFSIATADLPTESKIRVARDADGYKYPVRLIRDEGIVGAGQFNEEVSGIKDIALKNPECDLLPALVALRPFLKSAEKRLYVMTDDDAVIESCIENGLSLQSTILDMELICA